MRRETVGDRPRDRPVFRVFCVFRGYNTRGAPAAELFSIFQYNEENYILRLDHDQII